MGLFKSVGKVLKSAVKAVAAPFTESTKAVLNSGSGSSIASSALGGVSPWSSVVSGAVGLGGDLLSSWWNTSQQSKLNDAAFQQNFKMWNLQNAYNDPVAQMQRLEAANLNKNLVYGGGNVTGNTTSNYPTYEPVKYSGVGQFLNRTQQREIAMAQLSLGMQEFQQRVTNQGIQNGIALEKLELYKKINDAMLKNYGETTRGKKLLNDFFEDPFGNVDTSGGIKLTGETLSMLVKLFTHH